MIYRIQGKLNDGKTEVPPLEYEADDLDRMLDHIGDEMCDDNGEPFGVGFTLTVERVA